MAMNANGSKEKRLVYGEIEEILDELETAFEQLKKFQVLTDPPEEHRFIKYEGYKDKHVLQGSTHGRRIQQEWDLLETQLPESPKTILVRAYETRIDLMRAVLIGPQGTPYSNGLFFFDIFFPKNYPACPPKLYYHSYDLNLNPKLHPGGKVYLSLLETSCFRLISNRYGHNKREKWNPKQSTVLDVLLSIQNVILDTKPSQPQKYISLKNFRKTLLLTCEGMLHTLKKPPAHFEMFVAGHFRTSAHQILWNYKDHKDNSKHATMLFYQLIRAFEVNGTHCKHHNGQLEIGKNDAIETSKKKGFVVEILNNLKSLIY
ncbi:hypothetical protein RJ639_033581 [Escallonia herrerae]|uniref:UBC core domain-containing protein n=1 Tax=Escallonia herrerae TaxID=1293975 RepID=A0AA88WUY0_9ASTE|nr:hypothetical protein RJ639_033581 [Escallonia herrerae]